MCDLATASEPKTVWTTQPQLYHVLPAPQNWREFSSNLPIHRLLWLGALQACPHLLQPVRSSLSSCFAPANNPSCQTSCWLPILPWHQAGAGRSFAESYANPSFPWLHAPTPPKPQHKAFWPSSHAGRPRTPRPPYRPTFSTRAAPRPASPGALLWSLGGRWVALPLLREDAGLCTRDRAGHRHPRRRAAQLVCSLR